MNHTNSDMDNLDDSENNAKISDSAYSNSCSNSQSRRSHSSKSTHSGSSGSSGYGGKPSTSGSSNKLEQSKKDKDAKKKKLSQTEVNIVEEPVLVENRPPAPEPVPQFEVPREDKTKDVIEEMLRPLSLPEKAVDNMDIPLSEMANLKQEVQITTMQATMSLETSCQVANIDSTGFSCAISMHDGVVMYTTQSLTTNTGFPRDMWLGRSFIDFVHPKDRSTLESKITNSLAVPKIVSGMQPKPKGESSVITDVTMICRIRRYRGLSMGYVITDKPVTYMPFLLKFSLKDVKEDVATVVYLIIQATPIGSGYKTPNECKTDATPFVIRHSAAGVLEYIDIESVPFLGYLPQDMHDVDALMLYHPDDLPFLKTIYETIVKEGSASRCTPYRMLAHNGDFVKLETEWSSFINPWSMKLEFVIGKHYVVEGPTTTDVFLSPPIKPANVTEEDKLKTQLADRHKQSILDLLKDAPTKPAEKARNLISKRCHDLALIMESGLEEPPKPDDELRVEIQEPDLTFCERDSVMLGGISPHHEYNDSKSSTDTPLSYNQLNYNENLQRYFDSHQDCIDEDSPILVVCDTITPRASNAMMSPMAQHSTDSNDISSVGSSAILCSHSPSAPGETPMLRLTESLLTKHNNDMERELAKCHRELRTISKVERSYDTRQKKKEHLARCNAAYQPTIAGLAEAVLPHGVKRHLMDECDVGTKHHRSQTHQLRHSQVTNADVPMSHAAEKPVPWMYPQPDHSSDYVFPEMGDIQQQQRAILSHQSLNPLNLHHNNYLQACNSSLLRASQPSRPAAQRVKLPAEAQHVSESPHSDNTQTPPNRDSETCLKEAQDESKCQIFAKLPEPLKARKTEEAKKAETPTQSGHNSDETLDKTDEESSYSSFYSSFVRTESGSATDSSDPKKPRIELNIMSAPVSTYVCNPRKEKKAPRKSMVPPWMEQVCLTPELVYKYQIPPKSKYQVLQADLEKIKILEQPSMVSEQLSQLYLDLQLEGVASRLTLEEGMTSSSSSGDETFNALKANAPRRKREYSKLNMIYEENAPFPPPAEPEVPSGESSSTKPS